MVLLLRLCVITLFALMPSAAEAADIIYSPPGKKQKTAFVRVSGIIARGDAQILENTLRDAQKSGKNLAVVLDGSVGDVDEAVRMGRHIRDYRADTYHDYCASACVFAFLGGERRFLMKTDEAVALVVNRPEYADAYVSTLAPELKKKTEALRDYIKAMTGDVRFYNMMMDIPSTVPHTVLEKEAVASGLVTQVLRDQ